MLNERERRLLAAMERHLGRTDPELVRVFAAPPPRRPADPSVVLVVVGLAVLLLGAVAATLPIVLVGSALAGAGLWNARHRPSVAGGA